MSSRKTLAASGPCLRPTWIALALAAVIPWAVGCLQPIPPSAAGREARKQTYRVPGITPVVSEDGSTISSPHFVLRFGDGAAEIPAYRATDERTAYASGQLLQLEAQYEFLSSVFNLSIREPVDVLVEPRFKELHGSSVRAFVSTQSGATADGAPYVRSTAVFSLESFAAPAVLAHEMTHALESSSIGTGNPKWFKEGLAELVERELISGDRTSRRTPVGFDEQGNNYLQLWGEIRRKGLPFPNGLEHQAYLHAYYITSELRERYGDAFYRRLFVSMRPTEVTDWWKRRSDTELVVLVSKAAREDVLPFFRDELRFQLDETLYYSLLNDVPGGPTAPTPYGGIPLPPSL